MSEVPSPSHTGALIADATSTVVALVFPLLQLLTLFLLFVGVILLSSTVRQSLVSLYSRLYLRRLGVNAATEARQLAASMCRYLYLGRSGHLSLAKTFALALASFILVAIPLAKARVWFGSSVCEPPCTAQFNFVMLVWSGDKPDLTGMAHLPLEAHTLELESASAIWALPFTFLFHWLAETVAGLVFLRLTSVPSKHFFLRSSLGMFAFFAALAVLPALLGAVAVNGVQLAGLPLSWNLILSTQASLASGPGLLFGRMFGLPSFGHGMAVGNSLVFSLALLSSLTFATGMLSVLLANAAARSRAVLFAL
jgi:hypothetical protein